MHGATIKINFSFSVFQEFKHNGGLITVACKKKKKKNFFSAVKTKVGGFY